MMKAVQRVSVVGNSGSGKTTLARRLAAILGVPFVELDAIHHLPGWTARDPAAFAAIIGDVAASDAWVVDGNYRVVVVDGPVWQRADTVVWVDPPRRTVMRQVIVRTVRRLITREELWNGNREPISNVTSWDPNRSVIRWAWTRHPIYRERYEAAAASPLAARIDFVRLRSRRQAVAWLAGVEARARPGDGASESGPVCDQE